MIEIFSFFFIHTKFSKPCMYLNSDQSHFKCSTATWLVATILDSTGLEFFHRLLEALEGLFF